MHPAENAYDISFICKPNDSIFEQLQSSELNEENIAMAVGGLNITSSNIELGFKSSIATYHSGLKLIVRKDKTKQFWTIFSPISFNVFLIYIALTISIGIFIWLYEETN